MLILPVGENTGRRTLPWVCIFLIIINTLLYATSTHRDNQLEIPLTDQQLTNLAEYESTLLMTWLSRQDSATYSDAVAMNDRGPDFMFAYGWFNQAFTRHVHEQWQSSPPTEQWRKLRGDMEQWVSRFSAFRWGLIPNAPTATTFVSSMFMHGDWFHLLGNMVWLIIFGIAMERYWGWLRFSIAYLAAGLGAGLLFIMVDPDSGVPLVGASGAISGIMGLYSGTYRLRKVEFFYTLGFVFGSFRAPALVLFPVWLGWELVQAATADTNVAYMAHAGGLISGLILAFLLPYSGHDNSPNEDTSTDIKDREVPEACLKMAEELRFADAQQRCEQWLAKYPTSRPLWAFYLEMGLRQKQLDSAMKNAMKTLSKTPGKVVLIAWLWKEYDSLGGDIARLPPPFRLLLAELAWQQKRTAEARAIVTELRTQQWQHPRMDKLSQQLELSGP
ncbi:rhomboid family intramembrane serine protease [Alcanivorax sp. DP30]|uniref:rhomboid family intramembrane serine protease n=1 Tax=Alcanivorax sp. DP30 TaxID=2606217 RepID=UPI00136EF764|nr:rhomboid family intramembrane serine protease [Alcanivorax sp. DP30]MZR61463.1 rhomboid family intramembrane serine protease [Alcanivorax sp. DP30]